jgi:hypothetical protein
MASPPRLIFSVGGCQARLVRRGGVCECWDMTAPSPRRWIDRLADLHPLLAPPPPIAEPHETRAPAARAENAAQKPGGEATLKARQWAARNAEMSAARKADADAARKSRQSEAQRKLGDYENDFATWAGIAIVVVLTLLGLFLIFRLIEQSRLEDCLLAHRHYCDEAAGIHR